MTTLTRIFVPLSGLAGDANIRRRHPAEAAAWVWHPACRADEVAVLRFVLDVEHDGRPLNLHVSADQRFQLSIDGVEHAIGPDRSDLAHWSVHSYRLDLPAGPHRVEALVVWLGDRAPEAQVTLRGGFLLAVDGDAAAHWNTGVAPWRVERLDHAVALGHHGFACYHVIGPSFAVDMADWRRPTPAVPAAVIEAPIGDNIHGVQRRHWRLHPTRLHEQERHPGPAGRIRARCDAAAGRDTLIHEGGDAVTAAWQGLLDGHGSVVVPPHSSYALIWDLGVYCCGYPEIIVSGGAGAEIGCAWAESLQQRADSDAAPRHGIPVKGQRDAVDGKVFEGFGDTWRADGGDSCACPALWWRSGRFLRIVVVTGAAPLTIERLAIRTTGHPLPSEYTFACDDASLDATQPLMLHVLRMCAHETFVDCPYYEQLLYGGDGRLEFLAHYAVLRDDALPRRCIELFDWSRANLGLSAERYPSRHFQASATFAMFWPLMIRDHLWWRGDVGFAQERLLGMRCQIEHLVAMTGVDGTLGRLPGWSFIDWVPSWTEGCGPGVNTGDSSIVNLQLVLCLQAYAEVEDAVGDADLARRARARAELAARTVVARWWDDTRGLFADDGAHTAYSEHAQSLALIAGILDAPRARRCLDAWLSATDLARATVYFSFYTIEALYRAGCGDELLRRLDFWKGLRAQGFTTVVEAPEPARSDCHAWGAHPLWHMQASLAGIRPSAPGFARIAIAPCPGTLGRIDAVCPHPSGAVRVAWRRADAGWHAEIELPVGTSGTFRFAGIERELAPGVTRLSGTLPVATSAPGR